MKQHRERAPDVSLAIGDTLIRTRERIAWLVYIFTVLF